jgi:hypothetical protein
VGRRRLTTVGNDSAFRARRRAGIIPAMRIVLLVMVVIAVAADARADGWFRRHHGDPRTDLFVEVPLDYDTSVVFPFGGAHHAVPGVVAINHDPYYCRAHDLSFRDRARFVEHLSVKHGLSDREIPSLVVVGDDQVRYVGD